MIRFPDWPIRLEQFLRESSTEPFQYGRHDCCVFVANAVLAMTGRDLAADVRGRYRSRKEALALAQDRTGTRSIRALIETLLCDLPEVAPRMAQRGDIVLVKRASDVSLGLVALNGKEILAASRGGFVHLSMSRALCA